MAYDLDLKRVLCPPFGAEPFLFGRIADRTIPLLPIFPIKRMAFLAMGFLGVQVRNGSAVLHSILIRRKQAEMLRVDAVGSSAGVVYNHSIWNLSVPRIPRNTMRPSIFPSKVETTVPVFVQRALPHPTTSCGPYMSLAHKAVKFCVCKVHSVLLMARKGKWTSKECQYALV